MSSFAIGQFAYGGQKSGGGILNCHKYKCSFFHLNNQNGRHGFESFINSKFEEKKRSLYSWSTAHVPCVQLITTNDREKKIGHAYFPAFDCFRIALKSTAWSKIMTKEQQNAQPEKE